MLLSCAEHPPDGPVLFVILATQSVIAAFAPTHRAYQPVNMATKHGRGIPRDRPPVYFGLTGLC